MKIFCHLIQGNCLDVLPLLQEESIDLVITDPPYNLKQGFQYDDLSPEMFESFHTSWMKEVFRVLKHGRICYITNSQITMWNFKSIIDKVGFNFVQLIIWKYPNTIPSGKKARYKWTMSYQPIFMLSKGTPTIDIYGKAFKSNLERTDVWTFTQCQSNFKGDLKKIHPSQKPIDLIKQMIISSSEPGETILDPFLGSGTTMKAARDLNRNCIGIEIDPAYCEIARNRVFGKQFLDRTVEYKFTIWK